MKWSRCWLWFTSRLRRHRRNWVYLKSSAALTAWQRRVTTSSATSTRPIQMQCRSISIATARWLSLKRIRLFCDQGRFSLSLSLSLNSSYHLPFFNYAPCGNLCRNCLKHRSRNCIHLVENHPAHIVCLRFAWIFSGQDCTWRSGHWGSIVEMSSTSLVLRGTVLYTR